jgi:hypothetical protein
MPDSSLCVGDVHGRPVVVAERTPDGVVAVERDRILDPHLVRGFADVVEVALERELGRVEAHNDEALVLVLLGPRADVGERAKPVDAGVRPEVDEDDVPVQALRRERRRVQSAGGAGERRQVTLDGQVDHESESTP